MQQRTTPALNGFDKVNQEAERFGTSGRSLSPCRKNSDG